MRFSSGALRLDTTFPRRDCGAGPIAAQHRWYYMRLRHLPAPGGESAVTEEEAPPGLAGGGAAAVAPVPEEAAGEGFRNLPGVPGVGAGAGAAAGRVSGLGRTRTPRRGVGCGSSGSGLYFPSASAACPLASSSRGQARSRVHGPLRWVWGGPRPTEMPSFVHSFLY